ncbi:MAG: hypothetical protein U1E93_13120 [Alphaproteobacteria bacterium]
MAINTTLSDPMAPRRQFMLVQAAKASVGLALGLAFFTVAGRPDWAEGLALAGLAAPGVLALLGLTMMPLARLEQIGLAGFAALIGYLALLTGGMSSPLVVWFALVPAEAALCGGRPAVVRAGLRRAPRCWWWRRCRRWATCRCRGWPIRARCRFGKSMPARFWRRWCRRC